MSHSRTSPEPDIQRLIDEGYVVTLVDSKLIVHHVPYVAPEGGGVRAGTLAIEISLSGDMIVPPRVHMAWWSGAAPSDAHGRPLTHLIASVDRSLIAPSTWSTYMLCNKPQGREFRDYHEYVTTYVALLGVHAAELDPTATARRHSGSIVMGKGPFAYVDTATDRAGTGAAAVRITGQSIGIVGLGGTGSYVLDLVAKCPVRAIHLFDADRFEQHNAFRCPGAIGIENLRREQFKVELLARIYSQMHRNIIPHAMRIDGASAAMLDLLDFVFVCIDDGAGRGPILSRLAQRGIHYVDVGMGLSITDDAVVGAVRTTIGTPDTHAAAIGHIPHQAAADGIYASNIQVADLNALNAAMAVVAWKRASGFYASVGASDHSVFVVESGAMHRKNTAE